MSTALENQDIPRYLRVYHYYKELILSGKLAPDTKLPSIRKGVIQLQISRTTLENAYLLLAAEGYILSKPQSGYYVTDIAVQKKKPSDIGEVRKSRKKQEIQYDFVTSNVDRESFRFELWRRYMKSALRQDTKLLTYGEPQGEQEFREVLSSYLHKVRGVICSPEQIVIGAGVQSLLHILCPMIWERKTAAFYNPEFVQGRAIFEDYGFTFAENYTLDDGENKGRQDVVTVGELDGYYITNGKAIKIKCIKNSRKEQTVYKDLDGNEIEVNDGNTFVNICPINAKVTFE